MKPTTPRKMFVNLHVRDLPRSIEFFTQLGFSFNPAFTDETATCMLVGEDAYVMLLTEPKFKSFTPKQAVADTSVANEVLVAVTCGSREEVDQLANRALELGGKPAQPVMDLGFMYTRTFYDLDGHHWELFWMDPAAIPAG